MILKKISYLWLIVAFVYMIITPALVIYLGAVAFERDVINPFYMLCAFVIFTYIIHIAYILYRVHNFKIEFTQDDFIYGFWLKRKINYLDITEIYLNHIETRGLSLLYYKLIIRGQRPIRMSIKHLSDIDRTRLWRHLSKAHKIIKDRKGAFIS